MKTLFVIITTIFLLVSCGKLTNSKEKNVEHMTSDRNWKLNSGKTVSGKLVKMQDEYVIIRRSSGKLNKVKVSNLSEFDQEYVDSIIYGGGEPATGDSTDFVFDDTDIEREERPASTIKTTKKKPVTQGEITANPFVGVWLYKVYKANGAITSNTKVWYQEYNEQGKYRNILLGDTAEVGSYKSYSVESQDKIKYVSNTIKYEIVSPNHIKLTGPTFTADLKRTKLSFSKEIYGQWSIEKTISGRSLKSGESTYIFADFQKKYAKLVSKAKGRKHTIIEGTLQRAGDDLIIQDKRKGRVVLKDVIKMNGKLLLGKSLMTPGSQSLQHLNNKPKQPTQGSIPPPPPPPKRR